MSVKLVTLVVLSFFIAMFFVFSGPDYLTISALQSNKALLLETVEQHYGLSIVVAMMIYINSRIHFSNVCWFKFVGVE